jgi:hypothetical protein
VITKQQWKIGESIPIELWLINDLYKSIPNSILTHTLKRANAIVKQGSIGIAIIPDSGKQIDRLVLSNLAPGDYQLLVKIADRHGSLLGENSIKFDVTK